MIQIRPEPRRNQEGVVLISGLVVLMIITLIGVSAMHQVVLEEKMAGNLRDRNVAFQAAEAGLQTALTYLEAQPNPPYADANGSNRVWPGCESGEAANADACAFLADVFTDWNDNYPPTSGDRYVDEYGKHKLSGIGVAQQPRIVIEERFVPDLDAVKAAKGDGTHYYTASAIGYGARNQTRAILQTTIAVERVY